MVIDERAQRYGLGAGMAESAEQRVDVGLEEWFRERRDRGLVRSRRDRRLRLEHSIVDVVIRGVHTVGAVDEGLDDMRAGADPFHEVRASDL